MSEEWNQDPRNSNWTDANTVWRLTETEVNSSTVQLIKNRYVIEASLNHILTNGWSFVGSGQAKRPWSPCNVEGEKKEKGEVLHLFRCYTHTQSPGRDRVNPERQEEEKKRTQTTGQGQNSAGGGREQTDLQNQPTRRNGPNKHRAHTWTPQHITEGHGGRIRDRMGD